MNVFSNEIFFPINYKMSPAGSSQCLVNVLGRAAVLQCFGGGGLLAVTLVDLLCGGQKRLCRRGAWWSGCSLRYANPPKIVKLT